MSTIDKARIMFAAFFTPTAQGWGLPLLWWGAPGIGKTAQHKAFVRRVKGLSRLLEILCPGERGEGAFGVVPVPVTGANGLTVLTYPVPDWGAAMIAAGFGLFVTDELTTAQPAIQPALLSLSLEKRIGGAFLGKRVRGFAAANPAECSANGYDLTPPQANRYVHMSWELDVLEVCEYYTNGMLSDNIEAEALDAVDAETEEKRVLEIWPAAMASAAHRVSAFLKSHPDLAHKMPQEGDPNRGKAWPSPRSWELAIRCIATGIAHNLTPTEVDTLGAGCVGESAWQEYCDYIAALDLPDPASVLDGQSPWQPNTMRLDVTSAVIAGCVALVTPASAPKRNERGAALWALLDKVGAMGARDLTHLPATNMIKAGLVTLPGANKVMAEMRRTGFMQAVQA